VFEGAALQGGPFAFCIAITPDRTQGLFLGGLA
jgi:hypothetical protein